MKPCDHLVQELIHARYVCNQPVEIWPDWMGLTGVHLVLFVCASSLRFAQLGLILTSLRPSTRNELLTLKHFEGYGEFRTCSHVVRAFPVVLSVSPRSSFDERSNVACQE